MERLEVFFKCGSISQLEAWKLLDAALTANGFSDDKMNLWGKPVQRARLPMHIGKLTSSDHNFLIEDSSGVVSLEFCDFPMDGYALASVNVAANEVSWDAWMAPFVGGGKSFIMATIENPSYVAWQNETVYDSFLLHNIPVPQDRVYPHPNVNGRLMVDVSQNPGRRMMKQGHVEAVASTMWLGSDFWQISPANARLIRAVDWLQVIDLPNGNLKVVAQDKVFTSSDGAEGELQVKLRQLLFGA